MIRARTLRDGEGIPEGFSTGYENMPIMRDWIWIAEDKGPVGVLLAAPCHGLVYMMRLCTKEDANSAIAVVLLRACMKDCNKRGFRGYFFHVDTSKGSERAMISICRKAGGVQLTVPQILLVGPIDRAAIL